MLSATAHDFSLWHTAASAVRDGMSAVGGIFTPQQGTMRDARRVAGGTTAGSRLFIAVHLPSGAAQACEFRCLGPSRHLPPSSRKEPSPDISGVQPKSSASQFLDIMSLEEIGLRHC